MNLLDCQSDPGPLLRAPAQLAWQLHRFCDREACRVRQRARAALRDFATRAASRAEAK